MDWLGITDQPWEAHVIQQESFTLNQLIYLSTQQINH